MEKTGSEMIGRSGIFLACTEDNHTVFENIIPEHILVYVYNGTMEVSTAEGTITIARGQAALLGRNQLAKFIKKPGDHASYKAATVFLDQPFLKKFYEFIVDAPSGKERRVSVVLFKSHPLLENLFRSVLLFSDLGESVVPLDLAQLKMQEAVTLLRLLDHSTDDILLDFSEPHKINLKDFMQKNFMFNIPLSRFAYLTGRSLATFKRDFRKAFHVPPQKWLTESRLEYARFLIIERHMRPSNAFVEAGFENFSHFTFAFKNFFGYNASSLVSRQTNDS